MTYLYRIRCDTFGPALAPEKTPGNRRIALSRRRIWTIDNYKTVWVHWSTPIFQINFKIGLSSNQFRSVWEIGLASDQFDGRPKNWDWLVRAHGTIGLGPISRPILDQNNCSTNFVNFWSRKWSENNSDQLRAFSELVSKLVLKLG